MKKIGIINYGLGNPLSISNMVLKAGGLPIFVNDRLGIESVDILILPGVGSFDNAMKKLEGLNLIEPVKEFSKNSDKLLIGICLGFQILFDSSEEGRLPGLGLIDGEIKKFIASEKNKELNMGWRYVDTNDELMKWNNNASKFYFVHKYFAIPTNEDEAIGYSHNGIRFCCAIKKNNILGFQFHPEKSHLFGLKIFEKLIHDY